MDSQHERRVRYQNGTLERKAHKRGPDIWTYRWVDKDPGKRRRVTLGTITELRTEKAVKLAADGYRLGANREVAQVKGVTVEGLLDRYLQEVITPCIDIPLGGLDEGKMSSLCAKAYRGNINNWLRPRWGRYLVTDFLQPQVRTAAEEWLESLLRSERNLEGLAPKTVHGIGTLLRQIFRRAVKWGYLENNPLDFVDLPEGSTRRQKRPRSLSPAEYLALVELYGPRERAAIEVAGWMGPRRSEGFGLKWQDLDFERKIVSFRQGFVAGRVTLLKTEASQAEVSMPEDVVKALLAWREITPYRAPADWVFASPITKGKRPFWPESILKRIIQPIAQRNGFGAIGWHTFRHSFVSWGKAVLKLRKRKNWRDTRIFRLRARDTANSR